MRAELKLLVEFNEKVEKLERSRFSKRYRDEPPEVMMKLDDMKFTDLGNGKFSLFGKARSWVPEFDQDEIDAFVLTYRLLTQNNDRLSIANIAKVYTAEWMHPEASARFSEARQSLNDTLDSASSITIEEGWFSVRTIVEVVLYGGLAHSNASKAEVFRSWAANPAFSGMMWVEFIAALREALRIFCYLKELNCAVINAET